MSNDTYYSPQVIEANIFPNVEEPTSPASGDSSTKDVIRVEKLPVNVQFPPKRIAREVIGKSLDTESKRILGDFTFGVLGAISIGAYENGVTGDIRITPNGIVGRNINGVETFSINATTGVAVFRGSVQTGAVFAGDIEITGALRVTSGSDVRIFIGII